MVHEHVKHLIDLRAAGGGDWAVAPELAPGDYADGIDELLSEFLPRSRSRLRPLPGTVVLRATDSAHCWRIGPAWTVGTESDGRTRSGVQPIDDLGADAEAATVRARTGDLALVLWERADPLAATTRFRVEGTRSTVAALRDAAIHPW